MFTRLSLWLVALCAGLILLTRLAPAPEPQSALAISPCDLPCFFGVTPGLTTYEEARDVLAQYGPTLVGSYLITFSVPDPAGAISSASVYFDASGVAESARLSANDRFANVGQLSDVLLAGLKPNRLFRTCDQVTPGRFLMTFGANDQLLMELLPSGSFAPDTPIISLSIATTEAGSLYNARSSFGCTVDSSWHGFAPLWKYRVMRLT